MGSVCCWHLPHSVQVGFRAIVTSLSRNYVVHHIISLMWCRPLCGGRSSARGFSVPAANRYHITNGQRARFCDKRLVRWRDPSEIASACRSRRAGNLRLRAEVDVTEAGNAKSQNCPHRCQSDARNAHC
jgi:hypothetical protein